MKLKTTLPLLFLLFAACEGPSSSTGDPDMTPNADGLESDPDTYQLNSVFGDVSGAGKPLVGATITVLQTQERFQTGTGGSFLIVLDPKVLNTNDHKLEVSAEGFESQTHEVFIPDDNQARLTVELLPAK